jgi:hypothetical protein
MDELAQEVGSLLQFASSRNWIDTVGVKKTFRGF